MSTPGRLILPTAPVALGDRSAKRLGFACHGSACKQLPKTKYRARFVRTRTAATYSGLSVGKNRRGGRRHARERRIRVEHSHLDGVS